MTKPRHATLEAKVPGFQLVFFEVIWPAIPWLESIWIRENAGQLQLFVQTAESQDEREWNDLDYLVKEMFEREEEVLDRLEPDSKHKIEHSIEHGPSVPKDGEYRELMSDRMFKKIAKKHAPWRLEEGR